MFEKILIANRGEIACRVAATARRMGIRSVAVYSSADANARHVAACDEAVLIGPPAAQESYLRGAKIIEVALATGAQAIHPGYGFLSENEGFAEACAAAGLVFIGPPAAAIRAMGSKSAAKALMEKAAVPLVPGYHGENQDAAFLQQQADQIGYPVLLKASAGGGGKGMRIVEQSADFAAALASCQREAVNSFGDAKVLIEKYLTRPRHIEIQVFADQQGNVVTLFERDCSVQRRHQKVLEEAPAPGMSEERRAAMGAAAIAAARAVNYVGAGTVEFIAEPDVNGQDGRFYFMEMNTRLQVEHPVTEMITGTDLVEWQLRVAAGETLPKTQSELRIHGHALEARLYAENPEKGFLPSIGSLRHLRMPAAVKFSLGGNAHASAAVESSVVRIDSGVQQGDAISPFYDPMIAKLIVWGPDRKAALARMAQALSEVQVVGLATNVAFLERLVRGAPFSEAQLDTGLIERNHASLFPPRAQVPHEVLALAVCAGLKNEISCANDPWAQSTGWRLNSALERRRELSEQRSDQHSDEAESYAVQVRYLAHGWQLSNDGWQAHAVLAAPSSGPADHALTITLDGQIVSATVVREGDVWHVFSHHGHHVLKAHDPMAHAGEVEAEGGRLTAPMPGKIVAILVEKGALVEAGTPLLIMEAMKMEHTITAPTAGTVEELLYGLGDQVAEGAQLLTLTAMPVAQAA